VGAGAAISSSASRCRRDKGRLPSSRNQRVRALTYFDDLSRVLARRAMTGPCFIIIREGGSVRPEVFRRRRPGRETSDRWSNSSGTVPVWADRPCVWVPG
jgi:hypothetical protein